MPLNTAGSFEALFLLLSVLGGDDGHDLVLDLGHLAVDGANDLVHGLLVVLVEERQGEEGHPGEDDECHHVEPGADVGQTPEAQHKLDGVEPVLEEEEPAQLHDGGVGHVDQKSGHLGDLLGGDVHLQVGDGDQRVAAGLGLHISAIRPGRTALGLAKVRRRLQHWAHEAVATFTYTVKPSGPGGCPDSSMCASRPNYSCLASSVSI